jgi:hypothetical protein
MDLQTYINKNIGDTDMVNITNFDLTQLYNCLGNRYIRDITGYPIKECVYDPNGDFYVVHPDELNIKRNLLTGKIIKVKNNNGIFEDANIIISNKIHSYFEKCFSYNLFIDNNIKPPIKKQQLDVLYQTCYKILNFTKKTIILIGL